MTRLVWKTSDAGWGFVPPPPEEVDAFYGRIPGADLWSSGDVALVTGATQTSGHLMDSVNEALFEVELIARDQNPTPRVIGIAITAALVIVTACAIVILKKKGEGRK